MRQIRGLGALETFPIRGWQSDGPVTPCFNMPHVATGWIPQVVSHFRGGFRYQGCVRQAQTWVGACAFVSRTVHLCDCNGGRRPVLRWSACGACCIGLHEPGWWPSVCLTSFVRGKANLHCVRQVKQLARRPLHTSHPPWSQLPSALNSAAPHSDGLLPGLLHGFQREWHTYDAVHPVHVLCDGG